jgi:GNAT superfamily N-acetyltransferase
LASSAPPAGCAARPISLDDVEEISELFRRRDEALGVEPEPVGAFLRWMLGLSYVSPQRDTVVLEREGAIVASLTAFRDPASVGSGLWSEGAVDPAMWGQGLGDWLVGWLDRAVASRADEWPFDVHALTLDVDTAAHRLLVSRGFSRVRVSHEMAIDLTRPRPAPEVPAGVVLRTFEPGRDERAFWQIHEEAFEGHFGFAPSPYESFADSWYGSESWDPSRVWFADVDGAPVGVLAWIDADADGYIADVSVLRDHRRRGIARSLLTCAFGDIAAAGKTRATLTVDSENANGAVGLYEGVGMRPYRQWYVFGRSAG